MLKQPVSVLEGEKGDELEDSALRLFFTIQQHAGVYGCLSVCLLVCVHVRQFSYDIPVHGFIILSLGSCYVCMSVCLYFMLNCPPRYYSLKWVWF